MYRDGGVEPVEGASGRRVVSGCSSSGDPDTHSVVTTDVPMHAAESAGCSSLPAADVDPLDPAAHVARDDGVPAERLPPPVEAQATDPVSTKSISTRHAAASESVSASAPGSEVIDMTTDSGDQGGTWAIVASRKRKLNVGGRVAPPLLISPVNPVTEEKYELLVIVPGRSPLCFKCKQTGHCRRVTALRPTVESVGSTATLSRHVRVPTRTRVRLVLDRNYRRAAQPKRRLTTTDSTCIGTVELSRSR